MWAGMSRLPWLPQLLVLWSDDVIGDILNLEVILLMLLDYLAHWKIVRDNVEAIIMY